MDISVKEAVKRIYATNGDLFGVTFIKRTDGSLRTASAKLGVKKGVTGVGLAFNPKDKGLIPAWDMNKENTGDTKGHFIFISIEGLQTLTIDHKFYRVVH